MQPRLLPLGVELIESVGNAQLQGIKPLLESLRVPAIVVAIAPGRAER
jgi:hypothetical protein